MICDNIDHMIILGDRDLVRRNGSGGTGYRWSEDIKIRANIVSSQIKLHAEFGGVVPNLAAREHVKNISHVFETALKTAGIRNLSAKGGSAFGEEKEIDLIAVTHGPGLGPALLVGIAFAKTIAMTYDKPLVGTSHLKGHIYSNWLPSIGEIPSTKSQIPKTNLFPAMNLIVSGGHTELVLMRDYEDFQLIGETMDDAVGEAFDKVARLLGLGYPGGPEISRIAEKGNRNRFPLPRPMLHSKNSNFSFSGLKTAVLYLLRDLKEKIRKLTAKQKLISPRHFKKRPLMCSFEKLFRRPEIIMFQPLCFRVAYRLIHFCAIVFEPQQKKRTSFFLSASRLYRRQRNHDCFGRLFCLSK